MTQQAPLFPEQASTLAPRVDALFFTLLGISAFFTALIFILIITFAIRFRRRAPDEQGRALRERFTLEVVWTAGPLAISLVIFVWGAALFVESRRPPVGALDIHVLGKQWMWKFQHPTGQREINELHVPIGRPVRLTMASEDVIHSLFVPAFRAKQDVLPGRTVQTWFNATRAGRYRLYCAEYCGTSHSLMIGHVVAMEPRDYEQWLSGGADETLEAGGARIAERLGCMTCHRPETRDRGPDLAGLAGREVALRDGRVVADDAYLRESILNPAARIVAGYEPTMPTYAGQLDEEDLLKVIAWLKSLK